MTAKTFRSIYQKIVARETTLVITKASEYAREDRLHNFNRLARLQGNCREKALIHLCDKQYISLHDMIDDIDKGNFSLDKDRWSEKISDVRIYMTLLEACIKERITSSDHSGRKI